MIEYKNYIGQVEFDDEANIFHGEIINTKDVITFQGTSVDELRNEMQNSVETYLSFCAKQNRAPDKPFSGKFLIRLSPEQHREIYIAAKLSGESLNKWVSHTLVKAALQKGQV